MGEIEAENIEHLVVNDEHLAVIADEVVGSARDGDALGKQTHFEPAKVLLFALIRVGDERLHSDAATYGINESLSRSRPDRSEK